MPLQETSSSARRGSLKSVKLFSMVTKKDQSSSLISATMMMLAEVLPIKDQAENPGSNKLMKLFNR